MSERDTEFLVRTHLNNAIENTQFPYEISIESQPRISGGSKRNTGKSGFPEFKMVVKAESLCVIIECKKDSTHHQEAITEALFYARKELETNHFDNMVAVGTSGNTEESLRVTTLLVTKGGEENLDIKCICHPQDYLKVIHKRKFNKDYKDLKSAASNLHNYIRDFAKISESQKPLLIAGILISLLDNSFSKSYVEEVEDGNLSKRIYNTIELVFRNTKVDDIKVDLVMRRFSFILDHPEFNKGDILLQIVKFIDKRVHPFVVKHFDHDVLADFYGEFLSYIGGDKQSLGIILTPKHITQLMVELIKIEANDIVSDICCGPGGFLIAAMQKMMDISKGDSKRIENIKRNQLIGVEQQPDMFALAACNMLLRGDGTANIYLGSCFDDGITQSISHRRPTKGLQNPPYSQKGNGLSELHFAKRALSELEPGSLFAHILPLGCLINKNPIKKELLESHTLEAVMSMPDDLFHPGAAVVTCIAVWTAKRRHPKEYKTWFALWKDDGFEKIRSRGRIDINNRWDSIKHIWVNSYLNRETSAGISTLNTVTHKDEWCAEAYVDPIYKIDDKIFISSIRQYVSWIIKSGVLLKGYENVCLNGVPANMDIKSRTFKKFRCGHLFEIASGNITSIRETKDGKVPLITAIGDDNGISKWIESAPDFEKIILSIAAIGENTGKIFVHPYKCCMTKANIHALIPKFNMNVFHGLFISAIAEFERFRFSYGRTLNRSLLSDHIIYLPALENGEPDWEFIYKYMKSLPFSGLIRPHKN